MKLTPVFARRVFLIAGVYGLLVLVPQYFVELGDAGGPALDRPELHYGFVGVALTWQVAFLLIARDVVHFRPFIPVAVLEKLSFGLAAAALYAAGRVGADVLAAGIVDLALGAAFALAYRAASPTAPAAAR